MNDHKKAVKTFISETNQNRISETLSVDETTGEPIKADRADTSSEPDLKADEMSTGGAIPAQEVSQEPELLSAETSNLTPNAAAEEAEAVAGLPVGGTHGQEGEVTGKESF